MQNIGLLLPRSPYYQSLSFDMSAGFKASLKHSGNNDIRVVTDNIGFGTDKQQVYRAAEKMLMDEDAGIVFAYAGMRTVQLLRPLFMSANRLLIVLDSGACLPQEWPVSPNILYLSLHNSLGARLAAIRAIQDGFSSGGMITNYYDAGYLHTLAITEGFTGNGGTINFNIATGYLRQEFNLESLRENMSSHPGSCLLTLFSGDYAQYYFNDTKTLFGSDTPPAYTAPFMLEEGMLARTVFNGGKTKGVAAWSRTLDNKENRAFAAALAAAGREANLFSLLGWEAGTIAASALEVLQKNNLQGIPTGEAIKATTYESPRGNIRFEDNWNTSLSPMFEAELAADEKGNNQLIVTGTSTDIEAEFRKMTSTELGETVSGWFNSYICN